jgi:hypothetical protein
MIWQVKTTSAHKKNYPGASLSIYTPHGLPWDQIWASPALRSLWLIVRFSRGRKEPTTREGEWVLMKLAKALSRVQPLCKEMCRCPSQYTSFPTYVLLAWKNKQLQRWQLNSIEQGPSWEQNSCSASGNFIHLFWNPKVRFIIVFTTDPQSNVSTIHNHILLVPF